jgi:hypothetical protein
MMLGEAGRWGIVSTRPAGWGLSGRTAGQRKTTVADPG